MFVTAGRLSEVIKHAINPQNTDWVGQKFNSEWPVILVLCCARNDDVTRDAVVMSWFRRVSSIPL